MKRSSRDHLGECPSWAKLLRFVAEGGPWPAEHLRECTYCNERQQFLEVVAIWVFNADHTESGPPDCPDVVDVIALVEGARSERDRMVIVDHLAGCEGCSALFKEIVGLHRSGQLSWEVRDGPNELAVGQLPESRFELPRRYQLIRRAAAVVVLAVALTAVIFAPFPVIETGMGRRWRGPVSSLEATLDWPAGGEFPTLSANTLVGADVFRVRVWNRHGERLLERHRMATEQLSLALRLPQVARGEILFWQVDVLEAGAVISSSGPRQLVWGGR